MWHFKVLELSIHNVYGIPTLKQGAAYFVRLLIEASDVRTVVLTSLSWFKLLLLSVLVYNFGLNFQLCQLVWFMDTSKPLWMTFCTSLTSESWKSVNSVMSRELTWKEMFFDHLLPLSFIKSFKFQKVKMHAFYRSLGFGRFILSVENYTEELICPLIIESPLTKICFAVYSRLRQYPVCSSCS